jgi:hypothetical protein
MKGDSEFRFKPWNVQPVRHKTLLLHFSAENATRRSPVQLLKKR